MVLQHTTAQKNTDPETTLNNPLKQLQLIQTQNPTLNIKIESIGFWLWASGDTYPIKDQLKNIGFFYSGNKKAWYYNGERTKLKRYISRYKNLQEVREVWSSHLIHINNQTAYNQLKDNELKTA